MGIIGTRSLDKKIPGFDELEPRIAKRIQNGVVAVNALEALRKEPKNAELLEAFNAVKDDLGHGLLLKKYVDDVNKATPEMVAKAVDDAIPAVFPLFWSFRLMVGLSGIFLTMLVTAFYFSIRNDLNKPWLLRWAVLSIPLPWIACELGWFVAEYGRQPWTINNVLPTYLSTSSLSTGSLLFSLAGFLLFYSLLLVIEIFLMFKYARLGPSSLGTGRYHLETANQPSVTSKGA